MGRGAEPDLGLLKHLDDFSGLGLHDDPLTVDDSIGIMRIVRDANRASEIVERIRTLTKRTPLKHDPFNLNDVVLETIALTLSEIQRHDVSLRTELADDLPLVLGDRILLQQIVLNLIINAIEAIVAAGDGSRELLVGTATETPDRVLLAVHDTGAGLSVEKPDRLFEAFYTTKPQGMGMGLAISRSIIEAHGGRIWAVPNEPRGAIFRFALPIRRPEPY